MIDDDPSRPVVGRQYARAFQLALAVEGVGHDGALPRGGVAHQGVHPSLGQLAFRTDAAEGGGQHVRCILGGHGAGEEGEEDEKEAGEERHAPCRLTARLEGFRDAVHSVAIV